LLSEIQEWQLITTVVVRRPAERLVTYRDKEVEEGLVQRVQLKLSVSISALNIKGKLLQKHRARGSPRKEQRNACIDVRDIAVSLFSWSTFGQLAVAVELMYERGWT
jgi:hypothetical protein